MGGGELEREEGGGERARETMEEEREGEERGRVELDSGWGEGR